MIPTWSRSLYGSAARFTGGAFRDVSRAVEDAAHRVDQLVAGVDFENVAADSGAQRGFDQQRFVIHGQDHDGVADSLPNDLPPGIDSTLAVHIDVGDDRVGFPPADRR